MVLKTVLLFLFLLVYHQSSDILPIQMTGGYVCAYGYGYRDKTELTLIIKLCIVSIN